MCSLELRALLFLAAVGAAAALPSPARAQEEVIDRVVRYVNADIITAADQWELVRVRLERMKRDGRSLPRGEAEWLAFRDQVLDDITAELLKEQEADTMGVQVDERPLKRELRIEALRNGLDLETQSRLLEAQVRRQKVQALESYFTRQATEIGPGELAAAYERRGESFTRPARYHAYRLLLRPTADVERERTFQLLLSVFRDLQVAEHDALRLVITPERRKAYVGRRNDPAAQLELLLGVAEDALAAVPEGGEGTTAQLLERARLGLERHAGERSLEHVEATLAALREELAAIGDRAARVEAFTAAARRVSQGPQAELGGDMGWLEPGQAGAPYDQALADLPAGGLSPILEQGDVRILLLVAAREDARRRSLAEVSAELRRELERERRAAAVARLEAALRARAHIKDLDPLSIEDLRSAAGVMDHAEAMQAEIDQDAALEAPGLDELAPEAD